MKVGELWVALGVRKHGSFNQASGWLRGLSGAAVGVAAMLGMKGIGKSLFSLNAELQTASVQMAGMMAIVKHNKVADNMEESAAAVEQLSKRTMKLPGTLKDYATVWKQIGLPIQKAKGTLQDVEDITVATMTAMKIKDVDPGTASRSIMRLFNGTALAKDRVTVFYSELLGLSVKELRQLGKTVEGRQKLNKLLTDPKVKAFVDDYNKKQNKTFAGQKEELGERAGRFMARVGKGVFEKVTGSLTSINEWFDKNEEKVNAFADSVAETLVDAFNAVKDGVVWLGDHLDEIKTVLKVIAAIIGVHMVRSVIMFLRAWGPIALAATALVKLFEFLQDQLGTMPALFLTAFSTVALLGFIGKLKDAAFWMGILSKGGGAGAGGGKGPGVAALGPLAVAAAGVDVATSTKKSLDTNDPSYVAEAAENIVPFLRQLGPGDDIRARKEAHDASFARRMGAAQQGEWSPGPRGDDPVDFDTFGQQMDLLLEYTRVVKENVRAKQQINATIIVKSPGEAAEIMDAMTDNKLRSAAHALPEGQ